MPEDIDTSKGWCCDSHTYTEHPHESGLCCQAEGTGLTDLREEGQRLARERHESARSA